MWHTPMASDKWTWLASNVIAVDDVVGGGRGGHPSGRVAQRSDPMDSRSGRRRRWRLPRVRRRPVHPPTFAWSLTCRAVRPIGSARSCAEGIAGPRSRVYALEYRRQHEETRTD